MSRSIVVVFVLLAALTGCGRDAVETSHADPWRPGSGAGYGNEPADCAARVYQNFSFFLSAEKAEPYVGAMDRAACARFIDDVRPLFQKAAYQEDYPEALLRVFAPMPESARAQLVTRVEDIGSRLQMWEIANVVFVLRSVEVPARQQMADALSSLLALDNASRSPLGLARVLDAICGSTGTAASVFVSPGACIEPGNFLRLGDNLPPHEYGRIYASLGKTLPIVTLYSNYKASPRAFADALLALQSEDRPAFLDNIVAANGMLDGDWSRASLVSQLCEMAAFERKDAAADVGHLSRGEFFRSIMNDVLVRPAREAPATLRALRILEQHLNQSNTPLVLYTLLRLPASERAHVAALSVTLAAAEFLLVETLGLLGRVQPPEVRQRVTDDVLALGLRGRWVTDDVFFELARLPEAERADFVALGRQLAPSSPTLLIESMRLVQLARLRAADRPAAVRHFLRTGRLVVPNLPPQRPDTPNMVDLYTNTDRENIMGESGRAYSSFQAVHALITPSRAEYDEGLEAIRVYLQELESVADAAHPARRVRAGNTELHNARHVFDGPRRLSDFDGSIVDNSMIYSSPYTGVGDLAALVWLAIERYPSIPNVPSDTDFAAAQESMRASFFRALYECIEDDGHRVCNTGKAVRLVRVLQGYYPGVEIDRTLPAPAAFYNELARQELGRLGDRDATTAELDAFVTLCGNRARATYAIGSESLRSVRQALTAHLELMDYDTSRIATLFGPT